MQGMDDVKTMSTLVEAQVFGARGEWEKHDIGGQMTYVKPIATQDPELKARIAARYDELGFVPMFFRESGREFVALESIKATARKRYKTTEDAFVQQILKKL
ncbi:MAG: hypothetical protein ACK5R5_08900 [Alphaproteobacteria bacterium]|jgi:hypothetical protein